MTISKAALFWGISICCFIAVVLPPVLLHLGYSAASADESARALIAHDLNWGNVSKPFIWPPFYQVAVGLWLKIHPDLFYGPRVMTTLFGLLSLLALVALALELFGDRLVALVTAFLGVFLHHRLLLSVAPMSEAFFNCFVLWGAYGLARYSRRRQPGALVFAASMCMLAGTVRFEGWFVSLAFIAIVVWQQTASHWKERKAAVASIGLAAFFPVLWLGLSFYHYGDLSGITAARDQNFTVGTPWVEIARNTHILRFLADTIRSVLILGLLGVFLSFWFIPLTRAVILLAFLGMFFASVAAMATASNPLAAPWRISGAWVSQLVPFTAMAMVWLANKAGPALRRPLLLVLVIFAIGSLSWTDARLVSQRTASPFNFDANILALRDAIGDQIDAASARVLVDSRKVFFLDAVVALNRPDATEYTTGTDPIGIALHSGAADYWRETKTPEAEAIYERYLSLKYDPTDGPAALSARNIRFVLLLDGPLREQTENMEGIVSRGTFGPWYLYERL